MVLTLNVDKLQISTWVLIIKNISQNYLKYNWTANKNTNVSNKIKCILTINSTQICT